MFSVCNTLTVKFSLLPSSSSFVVKFCDICFLVLREFAGVVRCKLIRFFNNLRFFRMRYCLRNRRHTFLSETLQFDAIDGDFALDS